MSTKDGGLAFPGERYELDERIGTCIPVTHPGMTLRDYFAAKVMETAYKHFDGQHIDGFDGLAKMAYMYADAMLKARNK